MFIPAIERDGDLYKHEDAVVEKGELEEKIIKWRTEARLSWSGIRADAKNECANDLEVLIKGPLNDD